MIKQNILLVFGTRPEAIKLAPLISVLADDADFNSKVCVTAQHRGMLDEVLDLFHIKPDYDLNLMKPGQDLFDITSGILMGLREVLIDYQPDLVLVHGDTSTCFAATLAAFYMQIPVGHVEAGLRTGNMNSPWPEEANRVLVSRLAKWHFAPTERNKQALLNEGIEPKQIIVTGNTVISALQWVNERIEVSSIIKSRINEELRASGLGEEVVYKKYILITGHRRENFGAGFVSICNAISELAKKNSNVHFVYPVHLNPRVHQPVFGLLSGLENVHLIKPLSYESFVFLLKHCYFVLTDSGGVQEEAPSFGKPVLLMRETTERQEALDAETVRLVGAKTDLIVKGVQELLTDRSVYKKMSMRHNPYGDASAAQKILYALKKVLK